MAETNQRTTCNICKVRRVTNRQYNSHYSQGPQFTVVLCKECDALVEGAA